MRKMKLLKAGMPLMLAFSLLFAPVCSAAAESVASVQAESSETEQTERTDGQSEETDGQSLEEDGQSEEADGQSPKTDGQPEEEETGSDDQGNAGSENEQSSEDPDETPYQELIEEDNLIIVTVDQSGDAAEEMTVETVEELSEPQMTALEEYIEEQGYAVTEEAMLQAASESQVKTITFNMNGFISLAAENYGTGYDAMFYVAASDYQGNGNAYCIDPEKQAPGHDSQGQQISYTTTVTDYHDPMLLKIMYYGFGGPGDITDAYASTGPAKHILTHMAAAKRAAELGVPGAGDYTYRANSTAIAKADALYADMQSRADINGTVSILTPVEGQQTIMLLAAYSVPPEKPSTTELSVQKTVSGSGGNKNTEFQFELKLTSDNTSSFPASIDCIKEQSGQETENLTVQRVPTAGDTGSAFYLFTLQHGQKITFRNLPVGLSYQVDEKTEASEGYDVKAQNDTGVLKEDPVTVSFENSREMIIPTGEETNSHAMAGMVLAGIIPAGMMAFMTLFRRRSGRRESHGQK